MKAATLIIEILSDWHPGTGRGSGFYLDAVVYKDPDGLPRLPGRTLKGLLRDALERAERWQWPGIPEGTTWQFFGSRGQSRDPHRQRDENLSDAGALRVSDACLPPEVADYLKSQPGRRLIDHLYREHFSTAIDHASGVAKSKSLRGMEVIVPLTLEARISLIPGRELANWQETLVGVLPLINAVGAHRTRGFGRAHLYFKE